ncbi:ATP-dependent nuclease [Microbacterium maritypicum]
MYLERLTLRDFQSFGPRPETIRFDEKLTAFLGGNAAGKTAASQALLRLFSVIAEQRAIRLSDFHVPADESDAPQTRSLRIEAVFAFPELDDPDAHPERTVPELFRHMTAEEGGRLKLRIVLDSTWSDEGGANGTIITERRIVYTFDDDYENRSSRFDDTAREKIQAIYVPATRDGAREVSTFLRGRLWRAGQWSDSFGEHLAVAADDLSKKFKAENVVRSVTDVVAGRWKELHHLKTETNPTFEPINRELRVLVSNTELLFEPSPTGRTRPASELSDGQRSLLHIALTAATLDLEEGIVDGTHADSFDLKPSTLPVLTLLILEEPENNLSPFFLSRVVKQLLAVTDSGRAQAVISSHSASVVSRLDPARIRHFRLRTRSSTTMVRSVPLPRKSTDAGKYLRQAVRAFPELYFAKFVVLGEGDSEQVVLPILARARGIHIDQSFVSVVPLGGRHTVHFWRLLRGLGIPHATLLDLDYGRAGGGEDRIKDVCNNLIEEGEDPFEGAPDRASSVADLKGLTLEQLKAWLIHLKKWDIYFSAPLDLDMKLSAKFPAHYRVPVAGGRGPSPKTDARDTVLGAENVRPVTTFWDSAARQTKLRWYRYLFLSNSKPSTHVRALAGVSDADLRGIGGGLRSLITRIGKEVGDL